MDERFGWLISERIGSANLLVNELPEPIGRRMACLCEPTSPALVLGSTQDEDSIDTECAANAAVQVVRRRSGGGLVFVAPGAQVWLDVFVPAFDSLFERDVSRATHWLGEIWRLSLERCRGLSIPFEVNRAAMRHSKFSKQVCFCGLGPGEVYVDGKKIVGISQRRDRRGAWLFSVAPFDFDPASIARLVKLQRDQQDALVEDLSSTVTSLGALEISTAELRRTLIEELRRLDPVE